MRSFSVASFMKTAQPFKPGSFTKAVIDDELRRLQQVLSRQESSIRSAFAQFVRDAKDEKLVAQAADFLDRGDVEGALKLLDSYIQRFGAVIPAVYQQSAAAETVRLVGQLAPIVPTVAVSFDPTDARAAMAMREASLKFIQQFTDSQRAATRQALTTAFETGQGTQAAARAFRNSIGLTANQEAAVLNYRRLLEMGSRDALDRALRDRRFDPSVERAADGGKPLTPEQITNMVDRYRGRALASRAETIARTEALPAMEQAREAALTQNIEGAQIPQSAVDQTWNTTMDGRERDTHAGLDGQVQPLGQPFQSSSGALLRYPGDQRAPPAETINCRCHRTFRIVGDRVPAPA